MIEARRDEDADFRAGRAEAVRDARSDRLLRERGGGLGAHPLCHREPFDRGLGSQHAHGERTEEERDERVQLQEEDAPDDDDHTDCEQDEWIHGSGS